MEEDEDSLLQIGMRNLFLLHLDTQDTVEEMTVLSKQPQWIHGLS